MSQKVENVKVRQWAVEGGGSLKGRDKIKNQSEKQGEKETEAWGKCLRTMSMEDALPRFILPALSIQAR